MPIHISRTALFSLMAMIAILVAMAVFKDKLQPQSNPHASDSPAEIHHAPQNTSPAMIP